MPRSEYTNIILIYHNNKNDNNYVIMDVGWSASPDRPSGVVKIV